MTPAMLNLQWQSVSLYPAGYYTRNIPVSVSVIYPNGWQAATALRPASTSGSTVTYKTIDYDTLVDSPIFAGKYFKAVELSPKVPLNFLADEARAPNFTTEHRPPHTQTERQHHNTFG